MIYFEKIFIWHSITRHLPCSRTSCNGSATQLQRFRRQGSIALLRSLLQLHMVDTTYHYQPQPQHRDERSGSSGGGSSSRNKDVISSNIIACAGLLQLLRTRASGMVGEDASIQLKDLFEHEMIRILLLCNEEDSSSNSVDDSSFHTGEECFYKLLKSDYRFVVTLWIHIQM